jgi:hypothetical protein
VKKLLNLLESRRPECRSDINRIRSLKFDVREFQSVLVGDPPESRRLERRVMQYDDIT